MDTITVTNAQGRSVSVEYDWEQGRFAGYTVFDSSGAPIFARTVTRATRRPALATSVTNAGVAGGTPAQPLASFLSPLTFSYAYDAVGRPVERGADAFAYNARGEVTNATIDSAAWSYAYDHIGNRTTASDSAGATAYAANAVNQYTAVDSWTPSYDADGNLLGDGSLGYTWDAAGRLASARDPNAGRGDPWWSFEYDHRGRRVMKRNWTVLGNWSPPDGHSVYFYDDWNLIHEIRVTGSYQTTRIDYFWGPDLSGTLQGAGGVGGLVAVSIGGQFYFPGYDNNGNVVGYWDESGSLVAEYAYDAFGNTIAESGSMASTFPHRFSTKYHDAETDLYYYGYRYYSPSLGRWISRDTIEEEGGINLYAFLENNPVNKQDCLGMIYVNFVTIDETGETRWVQHPSEVLSLEIPAYKAKGTFDPQTVRPYYCGWRRNLIGVDIVLSIRIRHSVRPEEEYPPGTYAGYNLHVKNGEVLRLRGNRNLSKEAVDKHEHGHAKGYWMAAKPEIERVFGALPVAGWHRRQSSRDAEAKRLQKIHDDIVNRPDIKKVIMEEADKATLRYFEKRSGLYDVVNPPFAKAGFDILGEYHGGKQFDHVWRKK